MVLVVVHSKWRQIDHDEWEGNTFRGGMGRWALKFGVGMMAEEAGAGGRPFLSLSLSFFLCSCTYGTGTYCIM